MGRTDSSTGAGEIPYQRSDEAFVARFCCNDHFEKANVEGVVAVRPVSVDTDTYTTGTWVTANYSTLWGYYGYGWSSVYVPASARTQTVVAIDRKIISVHGSATQALGPAKNAREASGKTASTQAATNADRPTPMRQ